jgi:hypothetical protein
METNAVAAPTIAGASGPASGWANLQKTSGIPCSQTRQLPSSSPGFRPVAGRPLRSEREGMDTAQPTLTAVSRGRRLDTQFLSQHCIKVVIQEIATRRFWGQGGFWLLELEQAITFDSRSAALEAASHHNLHNVQLVLSRELKEWEIIPVDSRNRRNDDLNN